MSPRPNADNKAQTIMLTRDDPYQRPRVRTAREHLPVHWMIFQTRLAAHLRHYSSRHQNRTKRHRHSGLCQHPSLDKVVVTDCCSRTPPQRPRPRQHATPQSTPLEHAAPHRGHTPKQHAAQRQTPKNSVGTHKIPKKRLQRTSNIPPHTKHPKISAPHHT